MKDKNLLADNNTSTLDELTDQANQIIENLEILETFFNFKINVIGPGDNFRYSFIKSSLI